SDAGVARAAIARGRRFETLLRTPQRDVVLEVSASSVRWHGEQATLLLSREVTQRVRVLDALRASEERYRVLFENNPQPMWVEDAESGGFLAVNEAAVRHCGRPPSTIRSPACPTAPSSRTGWRSPSRARRDARPPASPSSSSTSTASSWSTTASVTAPATSCSCRSRAGWRAAAAPATRWRG